MITDCSGRNGRNNLLAALMPAASSLLEPHLRQVALTQGVSLQEPGEPIEQIYFPESGMISLLAVMQDGKAIELATVGREGVVGGIAGLGFSRASTRAVGQISGITLRITTSKFQNAIRKSTVLRDIIVRYNEAQLIQIQQTAACNALHDVQARLARWLLQTGDLTGSESIPLTQEFLSEMLGVKRTTVTLVAQTLQSAGLIRYSRGKIEILDRHGLKDMACECYESIQRQVKEVLSQEKD